MSFPRLFIGCNKSSFFKRRRIIPAVFHSGHVGQKESEKHRWWKLGFILLAHFTGAGSFIAIVMIDHHPNDPCLFPIGCKCGDCEQGLFSFTCSVLQPWKLKQSNSKQMLEKCFFLGWVFEFETFWKCGVKHKHEITLKRAKSSQKISRNHFKCLKKTPNMLCEACRCFIYKLSLPGLNSQLWLNITGKHLRADFLSF